MLNQVFQARLIMLIGAFSAMLLGGCTSMFFQPDREQYFTPEQAELAFEDVLLEGEAGDPQLHGWWFPAQLREPFLGSPPGGEEVRGTVLFLHGNAQNISAHLAGAHWLPKAGYNTLMLDYRGYGKSAGKSTLDGALADIERALHWLDERGELRLENKVFVFGQSLGGAMALLATAQSKYRDQVDGLIADSAFSNFRAVARDTLGSIPIIKWLKWPLSGLITNGPDPEDVIASLAPMPQLLIHGDADIAVPAYHSDRLFAAADEPKTFWKVPDVGHIEATLSLEMRKAVLEWMAQLPAASE